MSDAKTRTLDKEGISNLGNRIVKDCHDDTFSEGEISAAKATKRYNVALNVLKEAMLAAYGNGLTGYRLVDDINVAEAYSNPTINKRGGIMIGKTTITHLNEDLPEDQKFKEGDTFIPSATNGRIVLTLQSD